MAPRWHSGKEPACQYRRCKRHQFNPWVGKIPQSRTWQPTPVFLPGKFHGQEILTGSSPWSCKESDMAERTHHSLLYGSTLTSVHEYWKTYSFDDMDLFGKIISLLLNMLSRIVIVFQGASIFLFHGCSHCP